MTPTKRDLKIYTDAPLGLVHTHKDKLNAEILECLGT